MARQEPGEYSEGGWQGFEFVTTLSSCLTSWVATGDENDRDTAIKYWRVLLDDYQTVGDGLGGDDVVTHDTGYAMRTFAPYSALAYDWLHDAPGVTEELRAHARARFHAWTTYYSGSGYLREMPGANYHAGYVFAATLMAIAEAGEAGEQGEQHWSLVKDVIWQQHLAPALLPGGVLDGGDWPEGWQYGSLSVLEHALAARAMAEHGSPVAGAEAWASSLPLRFAHGLTPATRQAFVGGDSDQAAPYRAPNSGALLAALVGPASAEAKGLASELRQTLALEDENPLFDALALAASVTARSMPSAAPTSYLARGVGNWYLRTSWQPEAAWSVFQCSRRLVSDHQYSNAGNWVLTRGADDLIVDPSPYGSLSTLTGNAPAIDSKVLPDGYSPSQGYWGESAGLVWARHSGSGVAVARCDYADQFRRLDVPSDVAQALRDFVLIPSAQGAEVVLVDRVATGAAERGLHFRTRSPGNFSLSGDAARAVIGGSALEVRKLWASSGTPSVREMPRATECPSSHHTCDVSKLPAGSEYRLQVSGPVAGAIHHVSASPAAAPSSSELLTGEGYRAAWVGRVAVVVSDSAAAPLTYRVPSASDAVHVVLDAPTDSAGRSDVTAVKVGKSCEVDVKAHASGVGFDARPLVLRLSADCAVSDDGSQAPLDLGAQGAGAGSNSNALATQSEDGAGCSFGRLSARRAPSLLAAALGAFLLLRRRHPRRA